MIDLNELKEKQKKLDEEKYLQSQIARQDLGGRMPYCEGCYFVKFDAEKGHPICNLDENSKVENQVCAKNFLRRKESESRNIKKENVRTKPRTTRKTNNG